jgi:hypothetical protein
VAQDHQLQSTHPIRSNRPSVFLFVKSGLPDKVYRANAAGELHPGTTFVSIVAPAVDPAVAKRPVSLQHQV